MSKFNLSLLVVILITINSAFSQNEALKQNLRGQVLDNDTKIPLTGANVIIKNIDPILGASVDIDGYFIIKDVPVGRINIEISAIGYETIELSNVIIETGKETFLNIKMEESMEMLNDVTVTVRREKSESVNKMAIISAKTVTVEETGRYAGSFNDPARSVTSFAGVTTNGQGNNDIVVRGNSPKGILWKLEGIEIPNPNHFSGEGTTGGAINSLNSAMLSNSDFFTGAFAPQYGNALSGVFDVRFRNGNNQKREYSLSTSLIGTDISAEGPFSKNYNGSYLVNYRYSTLGLLNDIGVVNFGGVPKYQDGAFKISLPTKKAGIFSVFGQYGKSSLIVNDIDENTEETTLINHISTSIAFTGIKHNYIFNEKTYIQSFISGSQTSNSMDQEWLDQINDSYYDGINNTFKEERYKVSTSLNRKINKRNTFNIGAIYTHMYYNMYAQDNFFNTTPTERVNEENNTGMFQTYATWKLRVKKNITMVSGFHFTQLMLNSNYSIEPRMSLKWRITPKQNLTLGVGLHSKVETPSVYMSSYNNVTGEFPNKDLELVKSQHYVLGYAYQFSENIFLKTELYYQYLNDVLVEDNINSTYSMLNEEGGYVNVPLVNGGKGKNYGLELTLERYFNKGYYYLLTASVYDSKYTALDGIERNTRFNSNYAGNLVAGKEFKLPSKKYKRTLSTNIKTSLIGGKRFSEIDLPASVIAGQTVYNPNNIYTEKFDDIFSVNLSISYIVNRNKTTHEIKLDIQNLTNNQAIVGEYYNPQRQNISKSHQLGLLPNIEYVIKF